MPISPNLRARLTLGGYLAVALASLAVLPWIGAEPLDGEQLVAFFRDGQQTAHAQILLQQRLPRILLALLVGGMLSLTGATLQVLFRNPLAEPWTLGVAGGAAVWGPFSRRRSPL